MSITDDGGGGEAPTATLPPPPTLTPQPEVPTNFPHDPSTWTPAPPSDRVLEPWQVEDRTSYYRALQILAPKINFAKDTFSISSEGMSTNPMTQVDHPDVPVFEQQPQTTFQETVPQDTILGGLKDVASKLQEANASVGRELASPLTGATPLNPAGSGAYPLGGTDRSPLVNITRGFVQGALEPTQLAALAVPVVGPETGLMSRVLQNALRQGGMATVLNLLTGQADPKELAKAFVIGGTLGATLPEIHGAIAGIRDRAATPEGQAFIAKLQSEAGGGTLGGPPEEPTSFSAHLTPEQEQAAIQGQMENRLLGLRPPAGPEGNAPESPASAGGANLPAPPEATEKPIGYLLGEDGRLQTIYANKPPEPTKFAGGQTVVQGIGEGKAPGSSPLTGDPVGDALARLQARNDRADLRAGMTQAEEQYARQTGDQVRQKAVDLGASPQDAELIGNSVQRSHIIHANDEPLLGKAPLSQRIAAAFEGTQAGVVGDLSLDARDLGGALGISRNQWLRENLDSVASAIEHDIPNLKYVGDATRESHLAELSSSGLPGYAIAHPNEFRGWSSAGRQAINALQSRFGERYALLRARDPSVAEPLVGNYMMRAYEHPESELIQPLTRPKGEVSVAKERQFRDEWQAYQAGLRFKQMPLRDLITRAMQTTDQGVEDAFLRAEVLGRFGTRDAVGAKAQGFVPARNMRGDVSGWWLPPEIQSRMDQLYEPNQLAQSAVIRAPTTIGRSILTFPGDIGGLTMRLTELAITNPHNIAAGVLNRMLGDPMGVYLGSNLPREVALRAEGIQMGAAGSAAETGGVRGILNDFNRLTWGTTLGNARGLAYEGNLALKRLAGGDISAETEAGLKARADSRDMVNAYSGASRLAGNLGRRQIESRSVLSPQTTRALVAQFGQAAKLLSPKASLGSRLNAAATIAAAGTSLWGLQTLASISRGGPVPAPQFPVTWDGNKFVYNSKWGTAQIAGMHVPILRQTTVVNALAAAFTVLANEAKSGDAQHAIATGDFSGFAPKLGEAVAPEAKLGLGRLNVLPRAGMAALGFGFDPNSGISLGHLSPTQRLIQGVPIPIPASHVLSNPGEGAGQQLLGQFTGAYPLSGREKFLQATGLSSNATPAQIFEAKQKFPDAAKEYAGAITDTATGTRAYYAKAAADALTSQQASDQALAMGKNSDGSAYTSQNWKDAFHSSQQNLAFMRKYLGIGGTASNDPKVVQDYYAIFDKYPNADSDPTQKQAMYDEIDRYQANLKPDDQKTLDQYIGYGAGTTQTVREYRDTVKQLQDVGFFDIEKKLFGGKTRSEFVSSIVPENASPKVRALIMNQLMNSSEMRQLGSQVAALKLAKLVRDRELLNEAVKFGLFQSREALALTAG